MQLHYGFDDLKDFDFMAYLPIIFPVIAVSALLILIALIDLYRHRKTRENVVFWTIVVIFANTFGPILYFVIGRKDRERS
ncbi:PLD nuclease N-terminal domain-containing protein [Bacillus sp. JJ664]